MYDNEHFSLCAFLVLILGVKRIDKNIYEDKTENYFGVEMVETIHLCNIREKQEDGFYKIEGQLKILLDNK